MSSDKQLAVMIAKGVEVFPENSARMHGTIDVWWIVRILVDSFYIDTLSAVTIAKNIII